MTIFKAEYQENNKTIRAFQEQTGEAFATWKFRAIRDIKPKKGVIKWYMNGKEILNTFKD